MNNGIALKRCGRDFSERDRFLFSLLRPHLIQAYKNAKRFRDMKAGGRFSPLSKSALNCGLIPLDGDGQHKRLEDQIKGLFGHCFGKGSSKGNNPKKKLKNWVRCQAAINFQDGKRLILRLVIDGLRNRRFLSFEEYQLETAPSLLESLGLTRRETEVLFWIADGKTNQETALILNINPRTVEKHLERIFTKLGVENRTAAAARALEVLGNGKW